MALVVNSLNWCQTMADVLSSLAAPGRQLAEQTSSATIKTIKKLVWFISAYEFIRMNSAFEIVIFLFNFFSELNRIEKVDII